MQTLERATLAVLGTGYAGMANAVGFAHLGHRVRGFDLDAELMDWLNAGVCPYAEEAFAALLARYTENGRLRFIPVLPAAIRGADVIVVTIGTVRPDGAFDLDPLHLLIEGIRSSLEGPAMLVLRSPVPPGTSDEIAARLPAGVDVLYSPSSLCEGRAVGSFLRPKRTIVGTPSGLAASRYGRVIHKLHRPIIVVSRREAEQMQQAGAAAAIAS